MAQPVNPLVRLIRRSDASTFNQRRQTVDDDALSLSGETFKNVQLIRADFEGVDLTNTEWESCLFDSVSFNNANLEGAYVHGSTFINCTFEQTCLEGFSLEGCVVKRSGIAQANVKQSEVSDTQFADCVLRDLDFDEVSWSSVTFNAGEIVRVSGSGHLSGWTLRQTRVEGFETADMTLEHCIFIPPEGSDQSPPEGFARARGRRQKVGV